MATRSVRADKRIVMHGKDVKTIGFLFDDVLPSGAVIAASGGVATPEITLLDDQGSLEDATLALTIANEQRNGSSIVDDDGNTVAQYTAVLATVTAGDRATDKNYLVYLVTIVITTDTGEVIGGGFEVEVRK